MKSSRIILVIVAIVVVAIIAYSMSTGIVDRGYSEQIEKYRSERDEFMREDEGSPFAGKTESFSGLKYFPADPAYRVVADLEPVRDRKMVVLNTSDGQQQTYLEYAHASFRFNDKDNKLLILEVADSG